MENTKYQGNYVGTTNMKAKNQDMAFVNNTLERAAENNLIENPENLTETDKAKENQSTTTD